MVYKYNPKSGNIEPQTTGWAFNPFTSEVKRFNNAAPIDPDAQAWFTANNVVDPTQISSFNTFFLGLKEDGLYSKIYQGLPLSFNDATQNSVDMKLAFDATMHGGITHANGYVQGDGVDGYIDMNINPFSDLQQNNVGVTFFCNTDSNTAEIDAGAYENMVTYFWMQLRETGDTVLYLNDAAGGTSRWTNPSSQGLFTFNRSDATNKQIYKDGALGAALAAASVSPVNLTLNLMRLNPLAAYSTRIYGMWFVHESFDATEVADFHARITTLRADLGI